MHCPNCGKPATSEQQFCRACGMSLEPVGKLVAQHSNLPTETQQKLAKTELEQALVQKMFSWMRWGMIILGIGVALLVVNKTFLIGKWFSLLAAFFILGGIAVACGGLFDAMMKGASLSGAKPGKHVGSGKDAQSLPTNPIPQELPSVTERTTQLIGVEDSKTNKMMDTKARQ
ncbi:MAG TPA: zinc ribbon domain-containing protein [Pyrinomonadaceae bacterium]|nr:zinc ribbon domain-containing protein [Pyrinomonadaceae bacterium]